MIVAPTVFKSDFTIVPSLLPFSIYFLFRKHLHRTGGDLTIEQLPAPHRRQAVDNLFLGVHGVLKVVAEVIRCGSQAVPEPGWIYWNHPHPAKPKQ
jgi:hypothetical protein